MKKEPQPIDIYRPYVLCDNCNLRQTIEINFGQLIKNTSCPNCKCKTLSMCVVLNTNYPKR